MRVEASAKYIGTSARKVGLVAAAVRGQSATRGELTLSMLDKRAAGPMLKVLSSAVANAENNHGLKKADLVIEEILVGPAATLKRYRPRARGSASPVRHRSSHITVRLKTDDAADIKAEPATETVKAKAKSAKEKV
jgi:large subunit ribosomal protein L22